MALRRRSRAASAGRRSTCSPTRKNVARAPARRGSRGPPACPRDGARRRTSARRRPRPRASVAGRARRRRGGRPGRARGGARRDDRGPQGARPVNVTGRWPLDALELDAWLPDPGRPGRAPARERRVARAAVGGRARVRLSDTRVLGRLVRWRIPGLPADSRSTRCSAQQPFMALIEIATGRSCRGWSGGSGRSGATTRARRRRGVSGLVDARDRQGAVRELGRAGGRGARRAARQRCACRRSALQGRIGLTSVRPLIRGFQGLVGSEALAAAVRRAERG